MSARYESFGRTIIAGKKCLPFAYWMCVASLWTKPKIGDRRRKHVAAKHLAYKTLGMQFGRECIMGESYGGLLRWLQCAAAVEQVDVQAKLYGRTVVFMLISVVRLV
jgi:hypothetical protein